MKKISKRRNKKSASKSKSSQKDLLQVYAGDTKKVTESKTCVIIL